MNLDEFECTFPKCIAADACFGYCTNYINYGKKEMSKHLTTEEKAKIVLDEKNNDRFQYIVHVSSILYALKEKLPKLQQDHPGCCKEAMEQMAGEILSTAIELSYDKRIAK